MTREEALAVASERKAARHRRTLRIRKTVAAVAVAAFLGPFALIYANVASGKDPALAKNATAVAARSATASASNSASASSGSTTSSASAPAPITTQQS